MLRVTYAKDEKIDGWPCDAFNCSINQLKRKGYCNQSGTKFVGLFQPLNRLTAETDLAMWLNDEYKIIVSLTDYENFAFDIWHDPNHQLKHFTGSKFSMLEQLMTRAKVERPNKKERKRRESPEKWRKVTIVGHIDRIVSDFPHLETKGIRFCHTKKSNDYDFYVRASISNLPSGCSAACRTQKHAKFNEYDYCEVCDKWVRSAKHDHSGNNEDSYITIKYRLGDVKFAIFEYDNRVDKLEFIHKVMHRSKMELTTKNLLNRSAKSKILLAY